MSPSNGLNLSVAHGDSWSRGLRTDSRRALASTLCAVRVKVASRRTHGQKVNGSVGFNGRRPQMLKMRHMINGPIGYDM